MSCTRRDLDRNLVQKYGFRPDGNTDHGRMALYLEGRKVAMFKMPNPHTGQSAIGDGLLRDIARECSVALGYLKRMIGCTVSPDEYAEYLRSLQ